MFEYLKENPVLAAILAVSLFVIVVVVVILAAKSSKAKKRASSGGGEEKGALTENSENGAEGTQKSENTSPVARKTNGETVSLPAKTVLSSVSEKDGHAADAAAAEVGDEEKERESALRQTKATDDPQETESAAPGCGQCENAKEKTEQGETPTEDLEKEQIENLAEKDAAVKPKAQEKPTPARSAAGAKNTAGGNKPRGKTAQSASQKSKKKKNKNKSEEGSMYLEDLKNAPIEDENDFYDEEDEADRIAKYSGKWIICRVVTANSKSADVMNAEENEEEMFFFELRASNGEKLLTSEEYTTYNGALNGIDTHKANIARGNFKITLSKKGDYIFKLLSGKNMLLCMGEHYATKARCESAIESTKRFAKTAIVDENVQDIVITPPPEEDEAETTDFPDNGYNGKWIIRAHTAEDGEQVFYFELFASNGEKLLSSEEYTTYIGAINGIGTHKTNIERGNFRISLTKRGDYIYKLLNGNGQLLCLGEHYKTKRRCENAVESVKRFARNAPILSDPETVTKNA